MKNCLNCGKEFDSEFPTKVYCSKACRQYAKTAGYRARLKVQTGSTILPSKLRVNSLRLKVVLDFKLLHPCSRCGEADPACLQFHHRDPETKSFTIAHAKHHGVSIERLKAEIDKCEVVCANCHLRSHALEKEKNTGFAIPGRKSDPGSSRKFIFLERASYEN